MIIIQDRIIPRYNIFGIKPNSLRRRRLKSANELAYHICGFVYEKDMPAMINFEEKWYSEGVVPACIGACNKSIGYPTWISKSDIYEAISAQGLIVSAVSGYENSVAVVDKVCHKTFSPTEIIF